MRTYTNAVETHNLTRKFGKFTAVDQISFYIPKGEIFGLLGPNGAGKTTTIRMLCGIMPPSDGEGKVVGYDIAKEAEAIKPLIGYMSQKFALYNDLTVAENIHFYASIYGVPRENRGKRIEELLELVGLTEQRNELTKSLSGAWRQRLALACAIVHQPPMLFLDESTAGIDPVSRREFWDLIYTMAGEGISILATTHYMDEAEYCNTIGMMYEGRLIAVASPDTLKERIPGQLFELDTDNPDGAISILHGMSEVTNPVMHGNFVHFTLEANTSPNTITKRLSRRGIKVHAIANVQPSLEDIFIAMIEEQHTNVIEGGE